MNATRSAKIWIRRLIAAGTAVTASVLVMTSTAHAYIPPSPSAYAGTPGVVQTALLCGGGQISINPQAAVQANYVNGQWVTYRYTLVSGGRTVHTSGWSSARFLPYMSTSMGATYTYTRSPLAGTLLNVTPGRYWEVAVQVGWYTSAGWSYSGWKVPEGYTSNFASS